jgi:hypothetical protein
MKVAYLLAAAGVAAASLTVVASPAPAQPIRVVIGEPHGPGWYRWHDRRVAARGWDGPAWYNGPGAHHGWYHWNNDYYQNCSWRWGARHRRSWQCW